MTRSYMRLSITLISVSLLLLVLPLPAEQVPAWPKSPANCTVDGQVIDAVTKAPVAGAVVTIYNKHAFRTKDGAIAITDTGIRPPEAAAQDDPRSVTTDADGRFSFTALEPGIYVMAAAKESYLRTPYNAYNPASGGTIQLEPGAAAHGLVIRIRPESVLAGHVRQAGGEPIPAAHVTLSRYVVGQQGREFVVEGSGVTDAHGEYRLRGFEPGKYYVRASSNRGTAAYYPSSLSIEGAQPIEVAEGADLNSLDIVVPQEKGATIQGTIAALDGSTPMSLTAISREFGSIDGVVTHSNDGRFEFEVSGLRPGNYWLHAQAAKGATIYHAWMPVAVNGARRAGLELRPAPPADIHGRVEVEGAAGAKLSGIRLALDNSYSVGYEGISIPVEDDGTFTLKAVPAAVYRITPLYTSGAYFRAMRLGDADITEKGLDLTHGAPSGDLTLVLGAGGASIRGIVRDETGNGAAGALIALLPVVRSSDPQRARELSKLTFPDIHGGYAFVGVPPGTYRLLAWKAGVADGKTVLYDRDYVKPFEAQSRVIDVAPYARHTVDIHAIR